MKLDVAISPCPNDTFMFHGLATGACPVEGCEPEFRFEDVETLNRLAMEGGGDITKLSFHAYLRLRDRYSLLKTGAALGFGCGPVVVSRGDLAVEDLVRARIVVPGEWTTGHLLFRLWAPGAAPARFVPYDRILDQVLGGEADCGVIIHESRFVFREAGLAAMQDLGEWWERTTGLPIPLGCIAASRSLPDDVVSRFEAALRASITLARERPEPALRFAAEYARELDGEIVRKHVETFVNDHSLDLGPIGLEALDRLERMAGEAGIL